MKRAISILIVILLLVSMCLVACDSAENMDSDKLTIYNWADYIYDFEDDFVQYYHDITGRDIEVTYVTFDTNETMLTKMFRGDSTVDVMCPSEYAIQQLLQADMLRKINYFDSGNYTTNSQYVDTHLVGKVDDTFADLTVNGNKVTMSDYIVPYMWGTIGVLYNLDAVETAGLTAQDMYDSGWGALFNKDASGNKLSSDFDNRIYMKDSVRDSYAATLCYLYDAGMLDSNYSSMNATQLINTVDDTVLSSVQKVLLEQKEVLYGYEVDFGKNDLIMGNAYIDLAWSGDAMYAIEEAEYEDVVLDYYVPNTSNVWLDGWVIPKSATNVTEAEIFIDFLNSPYVAAQNMMEIGYTSAVNIDAILDSSEALAVLAEVYCVNAPEYWTPDEQDFEYDFDSMDEFIDYFFTDVRYPDAGSDSLGVMMDFGKDTVTVTTMWENVKSAGVTVWGLLLYTLLAVGVAVGIFFVVYRINMHKRYRVVVDKKDNN